MGGGEDALVGLEVDEWFAFAGGEMNPQKDDRVVEKEARRNGRHVRRGFVAEEDRVVSAVDCSGDGGAVGGVAPEGGPVAVDQLEAEMSGAVMGKALNGQFTGVGDGSGLQIGNRKWESGKKDKRGEAEIAYCVPFPEHEVPQQVLPHRKAQLTRTPAGWSSS